MDIISDSQFLNWIKGASAAKEPAQQRSAALAAAKQVSQNVRTGILRKEWCGAMRDLVTRHFPQALDLEYETAELLAKDEIPKEDELGVLKNIRVGHRARVGRRRSNDVLFFGLLHATTGERKWADACVKAGLRAAQELGRAPDMELPPAFGWHPHFTEHMPEHDIDHQVKNWMIVWPLVEEALSDEQRLDWLKATLDFARFRLLGNLPDVLNNLVLHGHLPALLAACNFPGLTVSAAWLDKIQARYEQDVATLPFITEDGYTREGCSYHDVNTRLLTLGYLAFLRGRNHDSPVLKNALAKAAEVQALFLAPDGSRLSIGDATPRNPHEHWLDSHEALHLAAALLDRPDLKEKAGGTGSTAPDLFNLWLMGPEGLERYLRMPAIQFATRAWQSAHAPKSVFHHLRAGRGPQAHSGILCFGMEHNHGHHDKGQILLYGLGRHLISDYGHTGYEPTDMMTMFSPKNHSLANPIRRTPMGHRTDHTDHVTSLGHHQTPQVSLAMAEHTLCENHLSRRMLALVTPWGADDAAFWLVWDRILWKRPWPVAGREPFEMIDTNFTFHAPGCNAKVSADGRSAWSLYDGPGGAPFSGKTAPRAEYSQAFEHSDSDANLQVTRLKGPCDGTCDVVIQNSFTTQPGLKVARPVANFRWRAHLPHLAGYVLVPYLGLRDTPYAEIDGSADADSISAIVRLPKGTAKVKIGGLSSGQFATLVETVM